MVTSVKIPFLNLKRQYEKLSKEVEEKVLECLQSGMFINGPFVAQLEKDLAAYLGVQHVIGCANGTDALSLALRACGVTPGDEVITSPFTFFATAEAIASVGGVPVFVDIRQEDMNIDPDKIETAITPKTKVLLPVHIFGHAAPMDEILTIAKRHSLRVVEDAAQSIGATYKGKKIGGIGDVTTFSFYPTKNLGACGDAGMVTTNDGDLAVVLQALREHGAGKNGAFARKYLYGSAEKVADKQEGGELYDPYKYYNYLIGYNSRLDAVQAGILSVKLAYLDDFNRERTRIAEYYNTYLVGCKTPEIVKDCVPCWHQYALRTPQKYALVEYLATAEIGAGTFYPVPLHLQRAFSDLGYHKGDLPVAEQICDETVCLPIFPELTEEECTFVADTVNAFFRLSSVKI